MRAIYGGGQRLLCSILNRLVDRKHDRLARMRLHLIAFKRAPVAISLEKDFAPFAANLFVVVLLDAA